MPLTKSGKKVLRRFKVEYGSRGKNVFYAYMKAHPRITKRLHKKRK
jgi:hypothetical protein